MIDDPLIGRQLANFRLERTIGRGGMAQVYYGYDIKLKRPVAVKVIDAHHRGKPAYARRFVREAQAIAQWRHEHIIQIYYADDKAGLYYFAMEYIDGQDLKQRLSNYKGKPLPQAEVIRIGQAIASALDYAHQRGVVHRDVKPSNVLLAKDGRVVLADFGLAMDVEQGSTGEVFGSANYLAPEQARHSAKAVPQSDLYSLGVMLYEMLTGRIPFNDVSPTTVALQHLTLPPPSPRQVNPRLNKATEAVLLKALSKSPSERYQTGQELMDALIKALSAQPSTPTVPTRQPTPKAGGLTSLFRFIYWVIGVLIVAAAGYLLWLWGGGVDLSLLSFGSTPTSSIITKSANVNPVLPSATLTVTPTNPTATLTVTPIYSSTILIVTSAPSVEAITPSPTDEMLSTSTLSQTLTSAPTVTPTATLTPIPPPPSPPTQSPALLADSSSEFSGAQGQGNWQYQWSKGRDSFDWVDMQFDGTCWRAPQVEGHTREDYVRICPGSAHPGAEGDIAWRWTSEVSGQIQIEVSAHKIDTQGGDGVAIVIYRNTMEMKWQQLAANDGVGFTQQLRFEVKQGDYIFFVLKATAEATHDETAFQARIINTQVQ